MARLTPEELEEFLAEYSVAHIATISADGSPYVVPGAFLYTGSAILITPRGRSVWYENLVRDPRVALMIDENKTPSRRVSVSGVRAELLFPPGHEKEWVDIKRKVEIKSKSAESTEYYLAAVSQIPYALFSVPFEYPSPSVKTWRMVDEGDDLTHMWSDRYGKLIKPGADLKWEGWGKS
jgi:hypothetical protein